MSVRKMKFGSLFSGIGGFDLGLERAGMQVAWQIEIDEACNRVLDKHWPDVRRYRDVREVGRKELDPVDLICGGFPCQDLSVAGRRAGLAGSRSGLWREFHRIVFELAPKWVVIENVLGLLSSNGGRDMGAILGALAELGYGYAYRVLDAQWFGVAQRRRRVFIVGHLGDRRAAEVLFEPESCSRDTPPGREARKTVANLLASGAGTNRPAGIASETDFLVTQALTCTFANGGADDNKAQAGFIVPAVTSKWAKGSGGPSGDETQNLVCVNEYFGVRRLTPLECERLQGFPDGWTDGESDSARYRMLGNAVCVRVAEWIGKRIMEVELNANRR